MINKIEKAVQAFLEKYNLLSPENTFLVAFSGGADSLCLIDVLDKISKTHGFKLIGAHLNHNWRGEESRQEEEKARNYCVERNITFYSETLPENIPHTELEARSRRYDFFNRTAKSLSDKKSPNCHPEFISGSQDLAIPKQVRNDATISNCRIGSKKFNVTGIFTGHTQTDQVETVLYRIIKGTGTIGLQGIPEVRAQKNNLPTIYRPILTITRDETQEYCKENNLEPSSDSSNLNQEFLRNRIRLSLIPELKTYNPNTEKALLNLSEISREAESLIEEYLTDIKQDIFTNDEETNTSKFIKISIPAQKRVLVDLLSSHDLEYDYEKIDEILDFINKSSGLKSGNTLSLTANLWLFVSSKVIKFIRTIKSPVLKSSIKVDGNAFHPDLKKTLIIKECDKRPVKFPDETSSIAYVDLSQIKGPLYFRTRQEGDRIQPFGMKEKTKLKKYLINKGVPEFERDKLPVVSTDSEILWVVGVGISELLRVKDKPTHIMEVI